MSSSIMSISSSAGGIVSPNTNMGSGVRPARFFLRLVEEVSEIDLLPVVSARCMGDAGSLTPIVGVASTRLSTDDAIFY